MRAQSIKHYKGTPLHEILLKIGKEITYTDWWRLVFPVNQVLAATLVGRLRPHQNRELWILDKQEVAFNRGKTQ